MQRNFQVSGAIVHWPTGLSGDLCQFPKSPFSCRYRKMYVAEVDPKPFRDHNADLPGASFRVARIPAGAASQQDADLAAK